MSSGYAGSCPVIAAAATGQFEAHGVRARLIQRQTGLQALNTVLAGDADVATVADVPFALNVMQGKSLVTVASIAKFSGDSALVVRADKTARIGSVLRGKRVAVTEKTAGHYTLSTILARLRVADKDVRLVNMNPQAMQEAFLNGSVDAVATWEPHLSRLITAAQAQDKAGVQVLGPDGLYLGSWLIAGDPARLQTLRPAVEGLLRALVAGAQTCNETPDIVLGALEEYGDISAGEAQRIMPNFRFAVTLDQGLVLSLEDQADWGRRRQLVGAAATPNFLRHIDTAPLRSIAPLNVTLIE
ncbi:MAG: ABC transporter substrate-binding protein [Burkholderiales bacterium]|nr:ABC transporter substrate-binding protein [Burkholderiales bacterium]